MPAPTTYSRSKIVKLLEKTSFEVGFYTVSDGTKKIMRFTLNEDIVPKDLTKELKYLNDMGDKTKLITAYCIDRGDWRSFYSDNVFEMKQVV